MSEINATDCSDEDIIRFIENVRGEDNKHYQADWIILRTLKILLRTAQYPEKRKDMKDKF